MQPVHWYSIIFYILRHVPLASLADSSKKIIETIGGWRMSYYRLLVVIAPPVIIEYGGLQIKIHAHVLGYAR